MKEVEIKGEKITALRGRTVSRNIEIDRNFDENQASTILAKYWDPTDDVSNYLESEE